MTSIKISEAARKAADFLQPMDSRFGREYAEKTIQLAINEACKPLVEALEAFPLAVAEAGSEDGYVLIKDWEELVDNVITTHRKEHGQ